VDGYGNPVPSQDPVHRSGWMGRVVEKQLGEGAAWGLGVLRSLDGMGVRWNDRLLGMVGQAFGGMSEAEKIEWKRRLARWMAPDTVNGKRKKRNEGGYIICLVEQLMRRIQRRWYTNLFGT
jgi:protein O-GlcNAc transferase